MSRRPRPRFRGVCAICDNTNSTTQLCPACYADPVNADWTETWEDVDEKVAERPSGTRLAELTDKKLRAPSELKQQILDLATRGSYESVPYVDKKGRSRGSRKRYVRLTFREIARRLGCSDMHVRKVVKGQLA